MAQLRLRSISALVVLFLPLAACSEEGKRENFAKPFNLKTPKCKVSVSGHERDELHIDCDSADMAYILQTTLPAIQAACPNIEKLHFHEVTVNASFLKVSKSFPITGDGVCVPGLGKKKAKTSAGGKKVNPFAGKN